MWLIVNAGSSSLKLKVFDGEREVAKAFVGEIGADGHKAAMAEGLAQAGVAVGLLTAAAHRVVHTLCRRPKGPLASAAMAFTASATRPLCALCTGGATCRSACLPVIWGTVAHLLRL